jgi:hypothetical protein
MNMLRKDDNGSNIKEGRKEGRMRKEGCGRKDKEGRIREKE